MKKNYANQSPSNLQNKAGYSGYGGPTVYNKHEAHANIFAEFKIKQPEDIIKVINLLTEDNDIERVNIYSEYVTRAIPYIIDDNFEDFI